MLKQGKNDFEIINHTISFKKISSSSKVPEYFFTNTKYQLSDVQILAVRTNPERIAVNIPDDTYLGHSIPASFYNLECMRNGYLDKNHFSWSITLFRQTGQGNLVVFVLSLGNIALISYNFLRRVNVEEVKSSGLYVILRIDGRSGGIHMWDYDSSGHLIVNQETVKFAKGFIKKLGRHFIGFAPHEQHCCMPDIVKKYQRSNDISVYSGEYIRIFGDLVKNKKKFMPRLQFGRLIRVFTPATI